MRVALAIVLSAHALHAAAQENFYPRGPWLVSTGESFRCEAASGRTFVFDSRLISRVKIITNDKGPAEDDVFWKIEYESGACYLPSSADKEGKVLAYFQKMKGFDNASFVKAMGSAVNAAFVVWQR